MYYDRNVNPQEFKVGTNVWLLRGPEPKKLENRYEGPYKVIESINNVGNVRIKINNKKNKVVHANRLRTSHINPTE